MASFAVDAAVAFDRGSQRGERSQMASMGISRETLLRELGTFISDFIVAHRSTFEARRRQNARCDSRENHPAFRITRDENDPKRRWVNGTPEYSLGICGLRKLFPEARFIHLVRSCDQVAASMMKFDRLSGTTLVETAAKAFGHWMKYVQACLAAEEAYGPNVVRRLFHEELVTEPEETMRRILDFIGEPFAPECLEPLARRINSSHAGEAVSVKFPEDSSPESLAARELWETLRSRSAPEATSRSTDAAQEAEFQNRVQFAGKLPARYAQAQAAHAALHKAFAARTEWALRLDSELAERCQQILHLQDEFTARTTWALDLKSALEEREGLILKLQEELERKDALLRDVQSRLGADQTSAPEEN